MSDEEELDPLDCLILRETTVAILRCLAGPERIIAALRLEGLNDTQIGQLLGVDRAAVGLRMARAQQRIMDEIPGAAHLLAGRRLLRGVHPPIGVPLERGWICDWTHGDAWPGDLPSPTSTNARPTGDDT